MDTPTQRVSCFQLYCKTPKRHSLSSLRDRNGWPPSAFNCNYAIQVVVSNNDFAVWWCQWRYNVMHTHIWENPWGGGNLVSSLRDGQNSTLYQEKSHCYHGTWFFVVVGLSWVSQYDAFHLVISLFQVLNPCLARCWENEVAWPSPHEDSRWPSCCWKRMVSLREYDSMGSSPNLASKYDGLLKRVLWCETSSGGPSCPFKEPSNESFASLLPKFQHHMWKLKTLQPWAHGIWHVSDEQCVGSCEYWATTWDTRSHF